MRSDAIPIAGADRLAVADISAALIPGQFSLTIDANRGWVRHQIVAWSVGLRWLTFEYRNLVHNAGSPLFLQERDDEYLKTVEEPSMEKWMRSHLHDHVVAHEAALMHGLMPGGNSDLPIESILIDRLLKEMVEGQDIDVRGPAQAIASDDDYIQFLANSAKYMVKRVGDRHFQLKRAGHGLPMLSTWTPLGSATYCGHALDLAHSLPETICAAATGRRLGDLIATGVAELDRRVVEKVVTSPAWLMDHWPHNAETRLYLEPDLVALGD